MFSCVRAVCCGWLFSDGQSVLPFFFRDSAARLLVDDSLNVSLQLSAGGRVWLIRLTGNAAIESNKIQNELKQL